MIGKAHFRVRGVYCGKCSRIHTWYKYRVWREGKKIKEEYAGKCDQYGNTDFTKQHRHRTDNTSWKETTQKSKLDIYRIEIEALIKNGSTQKFIAKR